MFSNNDQIVLIKKNKNELSHQLWRLNHGPLNAWIFLNNVQNVFGHYPNFLGNNKFS